MKLKLNAFPFVLFESAIIKLSGAIINERLGTNNHMEHILIHYKPTQFLLCAYHGRVIYHIST